MESINIFIRYSDQNAVLDKVAKLTKEGNLIYNDEGGDFKAHMKTAVKFGMLTAASPLIAIARLVRSVAFLFRGDFNRAGREFLGGLAFPLTAAVCFVSTLLSSIVYVISSGKASFYIPMRRTHAHFEAWINQIDLKSSNLPSYSSRVSAPTDFLNKHVWTTAPCMQPLLENGHSNRGGLLDADRMKKIFPFLQVKGIQMENDQVVIQSEYSDENAHYVGCGGAYEHWKKTKTICCCFRIEGVYDRFLCCEVSKGSCRTMSNHGDECGFVSCGACGAGVCCCYATQNHNLAHVSSGCFGPQGLSYITNYRRV